MLSQCDEAWPALKCQSDLQIHPRQACVCTFEPVLGAAAATNVT